MNEGDSSFEILQQAQREEQQAAAQQAAAEAAQVEATPTTSEETFQNPVGGIPGAAQQAADSAGEGLGQIVDAVGGVIQGITRDRTEEEDAQRVAGRGGEARDVAGAIESLTEGGELEDRNFIQQASDAAAEFLGLRSEEESNEQRNEGIEQRQEDAETARKNNIAASETLRTISGSVLGAAESTLEFAEIVGDTAKTFASKANIIGYDPKDDPFSDQYNWASWNLGKDDLGAQTPAGKIAQGFGEFGVTFLATGGGSSAAKLFQGGAKAALKQGGIKSVAAATAKVAGKEALEGVLTDVIMSASGEGNLTNLIKEHAPDWYPTWLLALAVEEDDNPFEVAFKVSFEGGLLGAPIGAVTGYLKGARAVNKLKKINPKATQAELQQAAYEAIQGELLTSVPKVKNQNLQAVDVAREFQDGDFSRINEVSDDAIRELVSKSGYDVTSFLDDEAALGKALGFKREMEIFGQATITKQLRNGSDIDWSITKLDSENPNSPYRIDWGISSADADAGGLGEGGAGVEMFSQIKDVVREADLKPGTIIQTEPAVDTFSGKGASEAQNRAFKKGREEWYNKNKEAAAKNFDDTYGEGAFDEMDRGDQIIEMENQAEARKIDKLPRRDDFNVRAKIYERAGFSAPDEDGMISAIVKADKKGRKAFEPLDINGDVDAQIAAARDLGDFQPNLEFRYHDKQALDILEGMKEEGIPHTWDDVAAVVPDLFVPGTREIGTSGQFHPEAMKRIMELDPTDPNAGTTVHPFTGEVPPDGYMVAVDGASLGDLDDPEAIAGFIARYQDVLSREDAYLGSWVDPNTKKPTIEISRRVESFDEAQQLGRIFDQVGIFDMSRRTGDFGYTPTGGMDQLKNTKGAHLKAISSRAPEPKPVDAQTAATQTVKGEQAYSPNTGAQGVLTSQQVRRLAHAGPTGTEELLTKINEGMEIDLSELAEEANLTELQIVQDAATKLGEDFGFVATDVSKLDFNAEGFLTRTGIVQARMVMKELSSRIARTSFKVTDASARGLSEMEHMGEMIASLKAFMKSYKISANLNSKRLAAGAIELPPEFGVGAKELKNLYGADDVDGLTKSFDQSMKMLNDLEQGLKGNNPKSRQKALQIAHQLELVGDNPFKLAQNAGNIWQVGTKVALKIMYNSMLSSPSTHIVNGVSNFVAVVMRPAAAAAGGDIKSRKAAIASFHAIGETLNDALEMAGRKWNADDHNAKGAITSDGEASLMLDDLEARAEASGDDAFKAGVSMMRTVDDIANFPLFSWPTRALTTADEFFKTATQRMEYNRMMMEEAIDLGGNDVQAVFEDLVKKKKRLNFTKSGESLNKELNRLAKEVTFQQDLEGPAKAFGKAVDEFPVLKVFFPFVRTGHNVATYTASYVPVLAQGMEKLNKNFDFDKLPPYEQAIIKGRQRIGTVVIAAAGLMAYNGLLVGNGPMDPEARKRWLEQNQPRSIKIGGSFVSLDRLEPYGPILSAVADIWYAFDNGDMKLDRAQWMAGYLAAAIGTNITDRTFFSGFQDFARFLNPRNAGSQLIGTGADALNNFIPAAGLRRTMTNALTPYMQEFNEIWDRTLYSSGIGAGLASNATRYDFITGEPVSTTNGGINALLPLKFNYKEQDPVKQALFDIEFNSDNIIEELGKTGLKLTPEQISLMQQHMGNSDLHKRLLEIVTAPDWKKAVQDYKDKLAKGGYRVSRHSQPFYREIKDLISTYADDALYELKQQYPELQESLDQYREDYLSDRYGGLTEFYQQ